MSHKCSFWPRAEFYLQYPVIAFEYIKKELGEKACCSSLPPLENEKGVSSP